MGRDVAGRKRRLQGGTFGFPFTITISALLIVVVDRLARSPDSLLSANAKQNPGRTNSEHTNPEYTNPDQSLIDAIECMKLPTPFFSFVHPLEVRSRQYDFLQDQLDRLIPNLVYRQYCWITSCGPWVEDLWRNLSTLELSEFGGFIPLFVPWNKLFVCYRKRGYWAILPEIFSLINPNFLYVTVTQNPAGIEGKDELPVKIPANIFVLSQGGQGHIPLLLWLTEFHPFDTPIADSYKWDGLFLGRTPGHAIRSILKDKVAYFPNNMFYDHGGRNVSTWKALFGESKFIFAPRGYGRNSFRITEVLQLGMLPVYIWNDVLWLPYYDSINWSSFAMVTHINDLDATLQKMIGTPVSVVNQMKMKVRSLYWTHFNSLAVFSHIRRLLKHGFAGSDLRCAVFSHNPDGLVVYETQ
jgi:hypothetical protein